MTVPIPDHVYENTVKSLDTMKRLLRAVRDAEFCPECGDGKGYTAEIDGYGDYEQVQCQWCDECAREVDPK